MTRFLTSRGVKALVVAAATAGGLLIGGVANADTPGGSQDPGTGTESPNGGLLGGGLLGGGQLGGAGGLDVGKLVGPVLSPILGGGSGGALGLDPLRLVGPVLQPILGGLTGGTGGGLLDLRQITGPLLGGGLGS